MSQFALRLPSSLADSVKRLAQENGVSMNQYVMITLAEQVGRADTQRFFAERAARANVKGALASLAKAPAVAPMQGDELPEEVRAHVLALREQRVRDNSTRRTPAKRVLASRKG